LKGHKRRGKTRLSKRQRIEELDEKLSLLKGQKGKIENEAGEWAEKRDRRNERFKEIRDEIIELKHERDKANERVKELKQKRDEARAKIKRKIEEIKSIRQEVKAVADKNLRRLFSPCRSSSTTSNGKSKRRLLAYRRKRNLLNRSSKSKFSLTSTGNWSN
jgi:chromosome segregation ATPase